MKYSNKETKKQSEEHQLATMVVFILFTLFGLSMEWLVLYREQRFLHGYQFQSYRNAMQTHSAAVDLLVAKAIDVEDDVFVLDYPSPQNQYGHVAEHGCIQIAYLQAEDPLTG